jgi:hypothetical protein
MSENQTTTARAPAPVANGSLTLREIRREPRIRAYITKANEQMADLFDQVDFVLSATNPDVAFPAEVGLNTRVGDAKVGPENNGALTIPANIVGNPAISIPVAPVDEEAGLDRGPGEIRQPGADPAAWCFALCGVVVGQGRGAELGRVHGRDLPGQVFIPRPCRELVDRHRHTPEGGTPTCEWPGGTSNERGLSLFQESGASSGT